MAVIFNIEPLLGGCDMKGRAVAFFAAAVPLAFVLGFVFWFHSVLSPGIVALGLLPPLPTGDLEGGVFAFLVNGVSWLVLFTAGYALICKRKTLIKAVGVPLCVVLALAFRGFVFAHDPFLPEPIVFWLVRGPVSLGSSKAFNFRLSLFADAISWFIVLWIGYKLTHDWAARGPARAVNKEAKNSSSR
jgi:hypothetical protein